MDHLSILFRWIHIVAGITWIGLLYFFNWVNGPFAATMSGDTKKLVVPELMPRALYWFRWGAAWTALTGVLMLLIIYVYANAALADPTQPWTAGGWIMLVALFITPAIYDQLAKSALGKNNRNLAIVGFVLIVVMIFLFKNVGGFGYRGFNMFIGAMFGMIMAFNVWMRIWPNQQKIITGVKTGNPADAAIVATAGARSKHNTYLSVPLVWTMINQHTVAFASDNDWIVLAVAILVGWGLVWWLYKKAATVKGF